jgi:hypothetical protein
MNPAREHLEPCPFCGDLEVVPTTTWSGYQKRHVDCRECKCCGATAPIAQWNTRAQAKAAPQAEPVGSVYTMEPLVPGGEIVSHARLFHSLPGGTQLYTHPPAPDAELAKLRAAAIQLIKTYVTDDRYDDARAEAVLQRYLA